MKQEIRYITTDTELKDVAQGLSQKDIIFIDTEFDKNHFKYGFHLCLIQISDGTTCYLIDPIGESMNLKSIYAILENPKIIKVGYAFSEDMRLFYYLGVHPTHVFDLAIGFSLLNNPILSLGNALATYLDIHAKQQKSSSQQKSNWFLRPLTQDQMEYAANDVLYLSKLYEFLTHTLYKSHRFSWMEEEMEAFERASWDDGEVSNFLLYKDQKILTKIEWMRFERLMVLRENFGKQMDKPTYKVLNKDIVFELAQNPHIIRDWLILKGIHPKIKTVDTQKKIEGILMEVENEAQQKQIKADQLSIDIISREEKNIQREKQRRIKEMSERFFLPVKEWLEKEYGEHLTHYFLSNKRVIQYAGGERELLHYQKELVMEAVKALNIQQIPSLF
ncbi:MAG: ribonuclease D [Brumimicrobium sp.]|nr:ribonuclease D [Brumimicrobium sp.]